LYCLCDKVGLYAACQVLEANLRSAGRPADVIDIAGGIGAPRTTSGCAAAILKAEMAEEEAQKLQVRVVRWCRTGAGKK